MYLHQILYPDVNDAPQYDQVDTTYTCKVLGTRAGLRFYNKRHWWKEIRSEVVGMYMVSAIMARWNAIALVAAPAAAKTRQLIQTPSTLYSPGANHNTCACGACRG